MFKYQMQLIGTRSGVENFRPVETVIELCQDVIGVGLDKSYAHNVAVSIIISNDDNIRLIEKVHLGTLKNVRTMPFIPAWVRITNDIQVLENQLLKDIAKHAAN